MNEISVQRLAIFFWMQPQFRLTIWKMLINARLSKVLSIGYGGDQRDEQARNGKDHGTEYLAHLRKCARNLARFEPSIGPMCGKRKRDGWETPPFGQFLAPAGKAGDVR